jgi:very-short-patch-repair endonuclease
MKKAQQQKVFARKLRREQTDTERILWLRLKSKQLQGAKFRRQQPIGPYIVDFVSFEKKLVIEIDGAQHSEDEVIKRDDTRTVRLRRDGFRVLRFWDNEVLLNIDGVLERIRETLR